jgi:hypothetical protein
MEASGAFRLMISRAAILAAGMAALVLAARAQESTLAKQSPFGGAAAGGEISNPPSPELELRGIMPTEEGVQYLIYDPGRKSGTWASVEETGNAFVVKWGDPALDEVKVETGGRVVTLKMRDGKVIPATAERAAQQQVAAPHGAARRQPGDPRAPREKTGL